MATPGSMDSETLIDLLRWIDSVKLSRPKKILHRDFADGVLVAEIVAHHFPACVEIHNYVASNNMKGKLKNWKLLNAKVLPKFGFTIPALKVMDAERRPHPNCGVPMDEISFMQNIISAKPNYIEIVLFELRKIIESARRTIPLNEINSDPRLKLEGSESLADLIGTPFTELNLGELDNETHLSLHRQHQALLACHKKMKQLYDQEQQLTQLLRSRDHEIARLKAEIDANTTTTTNTNTITP